MVVLAFAFLATVLLPDLAELPADMEDGIEAVGWLIWLVFALELAVKTCLAPDRRRYLASHPLDVIAVAVPVLRPLRLLRVLILTARFWAAAKVLIRHHTFAVIGVTSVLSVVVSASLIYAAERGCDGTIQTFADALWWSAATITTVGYGDVSPKTTVGRAIGLVLMIVGVGLFGLLTARVAAFFVESERE